MKLHQQLSKMTTVKINTSAGNQMIDKDPIGLRPMYIMVIARLREIDEAVERYNKAEKPVPAIWITERLILESLQDKGLSLGCLTSNEVSILQVALRSFEKDKTCNAYIDKPQIEVIREKFNLVQL